MAYTSVTDALHAARATVADERSDVDASVLDASVLDASVLDLVHRSRRDSTHRRRAVAKWATLSVAIPAAALALAGAAVTVDSSLHPDVIIPVHYVTDTGLAHDCTIYIEGGSVLTPGSSVIAENLAGRDWDGVGQRIYQRALELSQALATSSTMSPADRDAWAWTSAETQLTVLDLPGVDLPEGEHAVSTSDCTGELH